MVKSGGALQPAAFVVILALLLARWRDFCRHPDFFMFYRVSSSASFPELGRVPELIRGKFLHKSLAHSKCTRSLLLSKRGLIQLMMRRHTGFPFLDTSKIKTKLLK